MSLTRLDQKSTHYVYQKIYDAGNFQQQGWTQDEFLCRLQTMLLSHVCSLPGDLATKDPEHWIKRYNDLNTVRQHNGDVMDVRLCTTVAEHLQDTLDALSTTLLLPLLIHNYPDLRHVPVDELIDDTTLSLRHGLGNALFGPHPVSGHVIQGPNIVNLLNTWDNTTAFIRSESKDPAVAVKSDWGSLTPSVQAPNGLWLVPVHTSDMLSTEGEKLKHCVDGYLADCLFDGLHVIGVRRDPAIPEYTAAVLPNSKKEAFQEKSIPLGYRNASPSQDAIEAWDWYKTELNNGRWGSPEAKIHHHENRADLLRDSVDELTVRIGFDPLDPDAYERTCRVWSLITDAMGDKIRYRKDDLPTMVEKSNLTETFRSIASQYDFDEINKNHDVKINHPQPR